MGKIIWFTGLSGSGKTTLAKALEYSLSLNRIIILDGDELRLGLNNNLKFSDEDRKENIRRSAEVAKLFQRQDFFVICSFITPTEETRSIVRNIIPDAKMIHLDCSYETCEKRDVKGLYALAKKGEITNFTGKDSCFENPLDADLTLDTESCSIKDCIKNLIHFIHDID